MRFECVCVKRVCECVCGGGIGGRDGRHCCFIIPLMAAALVSERYNATSGKVRVIAH